MTNNPAMDEKSQECDGICSNDFQPKQEENVQTTTEVLPPPAKSSREELIELYAVPGTDVFYHKGAGEKFPAKIVRRSIGRKADFGDVDLVVFCVGYATPVIQVMNAPFGRVHGGWYPTL